MKRINITGGYIKLWRRMLNSPIWENHNLCRFWLYCLLKASHSKTEQLVGFQSVELEPGQFIFGRKKAMEETGLSERTIRTCLKTLNSIGKTTSKTTSKYTILTICNWEVYQETATANDQQNGQETAGKTTNKRPTNDHKQECKEDKRKTTTSSSPKKATASYNPQIKEPTVVDIQRQANRIGYSMSVKEAERFIVKYSKLEWMDGKTPIKNWRPILILWKNEAANIKGKQKNFNKQGRENTAQEGDKSYVW